MEQYNWPDIYNYNWLDEDYLFDITQEVKNNSNEEIIINNASKVTRKQAFFIWHVYSA